MLLSGLKGKKKRERERECTYNKKRNKPSSQICCFGLVLLLPDIKEGAFKPDEGGGEEENKWAGFFKHKLEKGWNREEGKAYPGSLMSA